MDDTNFRWYMGGMVLLAALIMAYGCFAHSVDQCTRREAIKAGLVQDAAGHWVRPAAAVEQVSAHP